MTPKKTCILEGFGVQKLSRPTVLIGLCLFMVALCNRADHIYFHPVSFFFFFSSPNLSGLRFDVYHTLAHGVALVRI